MRRSLRDTQSLGSTILQCLHMTRTLCFECGAARGCCSWRGPGSSVPLPQWPTLCSSSWVSFIIPFGISQSRQKKSSDLSVPLSSIPHPRKAILVHLSVLQNVWEHISFLVTMKARCLNPWGRERQPFSWLSTPLTFPS